MKKEILITLAAASLLTACRSTERTVGFSGSQLEDLPVAAQTTVKNEIGSAEIIDIDKERRSGRLTYEVTYQAAPGAQEKLHVTEDGRLLNSKEASVAGWILPEPAGEQNERSAYADASAESQKSTSQFSKTDRQSSATATSDAQFKASSAETGTRFEAQAQAKPATTLKSDSTQADYSATATAEAKTSGPLIGTKFEDLPAAVQKTIQEQHSSAEIADIDRETRDGQVVYQISFKESGRNPKIYIAEDGTLMSQSEFRERSGASREAVQLQKGGRGGAQGLLEQEAANPTAGTERATFGAQVESDFQDAKAGAESALESAGAELKETGRETKAAAQSLAGELKMNDLPATVQTSIRTEARGGKIATIQKKTVYEVKFEDSAKNPTLYFSEDGTRIEQK